ncbi:MAG: hypothetical protein PVH30_04040 [Desulfobacterales bacterium]
MTTHPEDASVDCSWSLSTLTTMLFRRIGILERFLFKASETMETDR